MKFFSLEVPNDYGCEDDNEVAILECYNGNIEAYQEHNGEFLFDCLSNAATEAGLVFVEESDFGATWIGTNAQFAKCVTLLPAWARDYACEVEK